jgi:hypothetical protein
MIDFPPVILPDDTKEAHKVFNSFPLQRQAEIALQAQGKDRLQYLFLSEHPEQLVQKLPELEVFLTLKEVGERDALELISLTTPEQFQYCLDLEFWKKDRLDPEKILYWMELLIEAGEKKVTQFIQTADPEFVTLLLKNFIIVSVLEEEELEMSDQISLFTLDHFYYIDFKGIKTQEIFEPFLKMFYRVDGEAYRRLMDSLIYEIDSELEETGYRLRNGRLSDYGFPAFEESLEIYRFVNPETLRQKAQKENFGEMRNREEAERSNIPFYLTFREEGPFFSTVLNKIGAPEERDRLEQEITSLCNKAIVAEGIELSNIAGMERAIKKVHHTLNLGLQYLSREDEVKGIEVLLTLPVLKIFQCGMGTTFLLKKRTEAVLNGPWFGGERENLSFVDRPYSEKFEGLLMKRPALYGQDGYGDFKDLRDLKEAEIFLDSIEAVTRFLGDRLNVFPGRLKESDWSSVYPQEWREITFSTLFLTAFANQILKGRFVFEVIEQERLKDLFLRIFERDEEGKGVIRMEIKEGARGGFLTLEADENRRRHLLAFQDFCFDLFEEEYGKIPPEEEVDPRFVKGLLIHR